MTLSLFHRCIFPAVLVLLCRCADDPVSPEETALNDLRHRITRISADVAGLRQMDFIRPVHGGVISREAYQSSIGNYFSATLAGVEETALAAEYAQMGFLPESETPLTTTLTDFYTSFPAAFYQEGSDSLYVFPDAAQNEFEFDEFIAHELTHALQDQHFNMQPTVFPQYSMYNNDALLAQRALIEGDAMFTEMAYVISRFYPGGSVAYFDSAFSYATTMRMRILNRTEPVDPPAFLSVENLVPYFFGVAFVAEKYRLSNNWESINALYSISAVPRSIAEINGLISLPVTYFDFHGIHDLLAVQPGTIEFADDDNAGFALLLGLLYNEVELSFIGESFHWRGDRYTFVKRGGQRYGTLVWAMAFSTGDAARYLFGKIAATIGSRRLAHETATVDSLFDSTGSGVTYTYSAPSVTTTIRRIDNEIWWLDNAGALTQPILDLLQARRSAPSLAKIKDTGRFSPTLSPEVKTRVLKKLLKYLLRPERKRASAQ